MKTVRVAAAVIWNSIQEKHKQSLRQIITYKGYRGPANGAI